MLTKIFALFICQVSFYLLLELEKTSLIYEQNKFDFWIHLDKSIFQFLVVVYEQIEFEFQEYKLNFKQFSLFFWK